MATSAAVEHDVSLLVGHIKRLGVVQSDGSTTTTFKTLFDDDQLQNSLESLAGTLKAAKRKKIIQYKAELLLQGVSDSECITLLPGK